MFTAQSALIYRRLARTPFVLSSASSGVLCSVGLVNFAASAHLCHQALRLIFSAADLPYRLTQSCLLCCLNWRCSVDLGAIGRQLADSGAEFARRNPKSWYACFIGTFLGAICLSLHESDCLGDDAPTSEKTFLLRRQHSDGARALHGASGPRAVRQPIDR
jgi:hypothetical protein